MRAGREMNKLPPPAGYKSWLQYAIATMDARLAFADRMFTDQNIPSQDEIRAAAQAELDQLVEQTLSQNQGLPAQLVDDIKQSISEVKAGQTTAYKFGKSKP